MYGAFLKPGEGYVISVGFRNPYNPEVLNQFQATGLCGVLCSPAQKHHSMSLASMTTSAPTTRCSTCPVGTATPALEGWLGLCPKEMWYWKFYRITAETAICPSPLFKNCLHISKTMYGIYNMPSKKYECTARDEKFTLQVTKVMYCLRTFVFVKYLSQLSKCVECAIAA